MYQTIPVQLTDYPGSSSLTPVVIPHPLESLWTSPCTCRTSWERARSARS